MTLEQFFKKYPKQTMKINGQNFEYRYYNNESVKSTLVLLTGGIGLSDLFYNHFERLTRDFSVITFDYLVCYPTMAELTDAMAELFKALEIKVWLVGQSLGGATAQIFAKRHPECTDGMVLSNTVSLQNSGGSLEYFMGMKERQTKSRRIIKWIPFGIAKKAMMKAVRIKMQKLPEESMQEFEGLADIMLEMLTKEYELHMIDMLLDCGNHLNMTKKDFTYLEDRVLLMLAEDDETFSTEARMQLVDIMTKPTVAKDNGGGHLGAIMDTENYAVTITDYIKVRE
ncbi:MAG: alpha/beta hydrolase [Lachnospiraceae bacterium]|nr:alpha/beta hydrolase [Lachnospiraceae bacterium]